MYQSLEPINVDWQGLQNLFRQQYSKIGNTRKQLFQAWRSSHFDENTKTVDAYVKHIRNVTMLLGYGEPQILEIFKNTLPTKLYWVLFPMENLRQAVEKSKRILAREKIDRQLAGQFSSTPFMSVKDSYNKRVAFDRPDVLDDKIDKLTAMMGKLAARDSEVNKPFKPQIYQSKRRRQGSHLFLMHLIITKKKTFKIDTDQIVEIGEFSLVDKVEANQGMNRTIELKTLEAMLGYIKIVEDRVVEKNTEVIIGTKITAEREVEVGREKGHFQ